MYHRNKLLLKLLISFLLILATKLLYFQQDLWTFEEMDTWTDGHMDRVTYWVPDWSNKLFQYRIFILKYLKDLPPEIQSDLQTFQNQYQLSNNELGIQNKY